MIRVNFSREAEEATETKNCCLCKDGGQNIKDYQLISYDIKIVDQN